MSGIVHHFFEIKKATTQTHAPNGKDKETSEEIRAPVVHIAVVGCCHGELNKIYDACAAHEAETKRTIDFLICCGDFQALRCLEHLRSMAVPKKYGVLGDFAAYHRGEKRAPYLTLFVGGNHEDSDWLAEESYGGFLAPNIYYMGHSGVVIVDGRVTVAGLSGIFKGNDYARPYPCRPFYTSEVTKRSAYHVRRIEVDKLTAFVQAIGRIDKQLNALSHSPETPHCARAIAGSSQIDIFVSHDWPAGITKYGDEGQLLRQKPFFEEDIRHGALGNPRTMALLRSAKPQYWLAAHLHCVFEAIVQHHEVEGHSTTVPGRPKATKFMALDKPAKGRGFIDFIDVPVKARETSDGKQEGKRIFHHPLWVEILRETHDLVLSNDGKWSADISVVGTQPPEKLLSLGTPVEAVSTQHLLKALGLLPTSLQQPFEAASIKCHRSDNSQQKQNDSLRERCAWGSNVGVETKCGHSALATTLTNSANVDTNVDSCWQEDTCGTE
ncbi:hypothetical protein TRVL_01510 [Trypanosoma vivax]|nr:hypothetical protein TRVL_01510 [Trypanosoma vivax]